MIVIETKRSWTGTAREWAQSRGAVLMRLLIARGLPTAIAFAVMTTLLAHLWREVGGGRFVVMSTAWDNPDNSQQDAGALTWGSITAGISGTISAENSLIGQDYQTFYGDNSQFFKTYDLGNGAFVLLFRQIRLDGSQKDAAMWVTSTVMLTGTISSLKRPASCAAAAFC